MLESYYYRLHAAKKANAGLKDAQIRRDLERMIATGFRLHREMSEEQVNCRRIGHDTAKYRIIEEKALTHIGILEQYVTLALLSKC